MTRKHATKKNENQIAICKPGQLLRTRIACCVDRVSVQVRATYSDGLDTTLRCDRDADARLATLRIGGWRHVDDKLCFQLSVPSKFELDCIENSCATCKSLNQACSREHWIEATNATRGHIHRFPRNVGRCHDQCGARVESVGGIVSITSAFMEYWGRAWADFCTAHYCQHSMKVVTLQC